MSRLQTQRSEDRQQADNPAGIEQVGDVVEQVAKNLPVAGLSEQLSLDVASRDVQSQEIDIDRRSAVGRGDRQIEDRNRGGAAGRISQRGRSQRLQYGAERADRAYRQRQRGIVQHAD